MSFQEETRQYNVCAFSSQNVQESAKNPRIEARQPYTGMSPALDVLSALQSNQHVQDSLESQFNGTTSENRRELSVSIPPSVAHVVPDETRTVSLRNDEPLHSIEVRKISDTSDSDEDEIVILSDK